MIMSAKRPPSRLSRRSFLQVTTAASGALVLEETFLGHVAEAAGTPPQFLLMVYFDGGWDQLLALDPRDESDPAFQLPQAAKSTGSGITPSYAELAKADAVL